MRIAICVISEVISSGHDSSLFIRHLYFRVGAVLVFVRILSTIAVIRLIMSISQPYMSIMMMKLLYTCVNWPAECGCCHA